MRIKAEDLEPLTSTEDMTFSSAQVKVYPNPVSDILNIEFEEMQNGQITIHNKLGELVSSQKLENSLHVQWDIFDLIPGIYSITISNMVGTMKTVRFVKI